MTIITNSITSSEDEPSSENLEIHDRSEGKRKIRQCDEFDPSLKSIL